MSLELIYLENCTSTRRGYLVFWRTKVCDCHARERAFGTTFVIQEITTVWHD